MMNQIALYNSLNKDKEIFTPEDPQNVRMYVCGPTVYDRAHLGNARAMVIFDVLYRILRYNFGEEHVTYARNITDVDDKINKASKQRNVPIGTITKETITLFHQDMEALHCLTPNKEPRATDHIAQMQDMIQTLIDQKHAYVAEGHVLFDTTSYADYGRLSRRSLDEMVAGARVEVAPFKKNPSDFVLWKPSNDDEPGWESPWGIGRPGWHIECSAMSTHYLGKDFDIHGGGADLQFPHHENEIAQSCCTYPQSHYAKYWVHNGFLTVDGEKMSKSLGNFITLGDVLEKQHLHGEVIRYALLSSHYRKPLDWTEKRLSDAQKALKGFYEILNEHPEVEIAEKIPEAFLNALYDDINTPLAFSTLHTLANAFHKAANQEEKTKIVQQLKACGKLIGLLESDPALWRKDNTVNHDEAKHIETLLEKRKIARTEKNWQEADRIRDELQAMDVAIKDNPDGTTSWSKL